MASMTPSLAAVDKELKKRMGSIPDVGVFNCRPFRIDGKLRPDKGWSEHAWANAIDYKINGFSKQKPYVDTLNRMRSEGFPVGTVLWAGNRPSDHSDHIHTEGSPKQGPAGPPPCKGGSPVNVKDDDIDDPKEGGRISGGGTRTHGEGEDSDIKWWDWLIDPAGTAAKASADWFEENVKPIIIRIGFGVLAAILVSVTLFMLAKAFADSQGIDLKAIATRGIVQG